MIWIKRTALGLLSVIFVVGLTAFIWATLPVVVDRENADAAVTVLADRANADVGYKEGYFEHAGNTLHYVEAGEGEPIVFLHGFPSYWFSFVRQIEHFGGDYRVIAIDGLGAGKSDAPSNDEPYRLEAMGAHVAALLDHLGEERVHLVGHDWGSAFATGLAQRYPDRVLSVTGISAPALNASLHALESDAKARESAAYVERFKQANPPLLVLLGTADAIYDGAYRPLVEDGKLSPEEGELFRKATSDPKRTNAHINWYRANIPHPDDLSDSDFWPSRAAQVSMPALYIWGEDDPIYNPAAMDRLVALSDQSRTITFPGVGHWPHVRKAEEVNAAITAHIAAASPTGND
ncbi:alpha/beta fold hydrolase [Altererythrobacter lutimaris]|uniref:Alpha/beta hydrolase n=1 Tax=Altererythrobacter lutimaris TaxID=2743979 RepID=A0A850H996_9SPHN|nr:alpha/beta hydrolase [Altererythrobacter lutimaris]NVE94339.1 alpha/beta hydrolase [Altererythrobacter lutimaris]